MIITHRLATQAIAYRPAAVYVRVRLPFSVPADDHKIGVRVYTRPSGFVDETLAWNGMAVVSVKDVTLPQPREWSFHLDLWQHLTSRALRRARSAAAPPHERLRAVSRLHRVPLWSDAHFRVIEGYYQSLSELGQKAVTGMWYSVPSPAVAALTHKLPAQWSPRRCRGLGSSASVMYPPPALASTTRSVTRRARARACCVLHSPCQRKYPSYLFEHAIVRVRAAPPGPRCGALVSWRLSRRACVGRSFATRCGRRRWRRLVWGRPLRKRACRRVRQRQRPRAQGTSWNLTFRAWTSSSRWPRGLAWTVRLRCLACSGMQSARQAGRGSLLRSRRACVGHSVWEDSEFGFGSVIHDGPDTFVRVACLDARTGAMGYLRSMEELRAFIAALHISPHRRL